MNSGSKFATECFVISPIGAIASPERKRSDDVLKYIVSLAAKELGLEAVRADQIGAPGQITLQVIEHVLKAKAAVVDLTGLNPNVFYELALRHAVKLPVALIAAADSRLPFDIAQMRTIFFDHTDLGSANECRQAIVAHLREAIDNGAVDSPIATSIDIQAMQVGNAVERNLADLVAVIQQLSAGQSSLASIVGGLQIPTPAKTGQYRTMGLTLQATVRELRGAFASGDEPRVTDTIRNLEALAESYVMGLATRQADDELRAIRQAISWQIEIAARREAAGDANNTGRESHDL